jgi:SAM-dependent methyltransferase
VREKEAQRVEDVSVTPPACPACRARSTRDFLRRERVPVHQNLVYPSASEARRDARGTLLLCVCTECGFVFNSAFAPELLRYGPHYDNTQDCSSVFTRHVDGLVRHLVEERGLRRKRIVEVGCGKGSFLRKLVTYPGAENLGFGFDPSYLGPDSELEGRLVFHRERYDQASAIQADAVLCRHVIEHVPDPVALLLSVRSALDDRDDARVFFETPCVSWTLKNRVIWDFFYEHCSLFTAGSLSTAFERAGFRVESVRHVFGDQYLWLEAVPGARPAMPSRDAGEMEGLAFKYSEAEESVIEGWKRKIGELARSGRVAIWGAGAKGATFANLVDPDAVRIDCAVDLNPGKKGKFIPGTGHPIVSYRELPRRGVTEVILMNPNYRDENLALLREARIDANLVEWL